MSPGSDSSPSIRHARTSKSQKIQEFLAAGLTEKCVVEIHVPKRGRMTGMTFSVLLWAKEALLRVLFEREESEMVFDFSEHDEIS